MLVLQKSSGSQTPGRDRLVSWGKRYISEARLPDAAKAMLKMIR